MTSSMQLDLFAPQPRASARDDEGHSAEHPSGVFEAAPAEPINHAAVGARIRLLHEWMERSGTVFESGIVAREPWTEYRDGTRALGKFYGELRKRAVPLTKEEQHEEYLRAFVWVSYEYAVGRAKVKLAVPSARAQAHHVTREFVLESAHAFSLIIGAPKDAIAAWLLTGEQPTSTST